MTTLTLPSPPDVVEPSFGDLYRLVTELSARLGRIETVMVPSESAELSLNQIVHEFRGVTRPMVRAKIAEGAFEPGEYRACRTRGGYDSFVVKRFAAARVFSTSEINRLVRAAR